MMERVKGVVAVHVIAVASGLAVGMGIAIVNYLLKEKRREAEEVLMDLQLPQEVPHANPIVSIFQQGVLSINSQEEESKGHDDTTLYVCEQVPSTWKYKWHVIKILEGFNLKYLRQLPEIKYYTHVHDFKTAILGCHLFVVGGGGFSSERVYSIDIENSKSVWQTSHFMYGRDPRQLHLVVFRGSLYAFGGVIEDFIECDSRCWAEVYDEGSNRWKPVEVKFDCRLPVSVFGHLIDPEGRLILFGCKTTLRCDVEGRQCNITLLEDSFGDDVVFRPVRIRQHLYVLNCMNMVLNCYDINTGGLSSRRVPLPRVVGDLKSSHTVTTDKASLCHFIPLGDDALYMIQLFRPARANGRHFLRCRKCVLREVEGGNSNESDFSRNMSYVQSPELLVEFLSIKKCMIVRGDSFADSVNQGMFYSD